MELLNKARDILELPSGEWMFPEPAKEPHYSKFYGNKAPIPLNELPTVPNNFVANQVALYYTTPGTVDGVRWWKEEMKIKLYGNN